MGFLLVVVLVVVLVDVLVTGGKQSQLLVPDRSLDFGLRTGV